MIFTHWFSPIQKALSLSSTGRANNATDHLFTIAKRKLFSIAPTEVSTAKRGFQVDDPYKQERIEAIGLSFLAGYHAAIDAQSTDQLHQSLESVSSEYKGFAYEGAAMGLGLMDQLFPWRSSQFSIFLTDARNLYPYLTYVGLGWSLARLPGGIVNFSKRLVESLSPSTETASNNSLLTCLVIDGYGFHQGYFVWKKYVQEKFEPIYLPPACLPLFNQGLGRSLCFVLGMDGERIATTIKQFPQSRQADLWSGVGLAVTYAGGLTGSDIESLKKQSQEYLPAFAQGVAFAAKARQRANYVPEHTVLVCQLVWGQPVEVIANLTDTKLWDLPLNSKLEAYRIWRQRLQQAFASYPS